MPPDPKIKLYGRPPLAPYIKVRMEYQPESNLLLSDLTAFFYENAKAMEFNEERPDFWESIFKAVLASQSCEH